MSNVEKAIELLQERIAYLDELADAVVIASDDDLQQQHHYYNEINNITDALYYLEMLI